MSTNETLSEALRGHARRLSADGENLYRVRAFRQAAFAVLATAAPVEGLSVAELARLPGVGASLAQTIYALARGESLGERPLAG